MLFDKRRFVFALAVSRHLDFHSAGAALHYLPGITVPAVVRPLIFSRISSIRDHFRVRCPEPPGSFRRSASSQIRGHFHILDPVFFDHLPQLAFPFSFHNKTPVVSFYLT